MRKLLIIILLLPVIAWAVSVSTTTDRNYDGTQDTRYPNGGKPNTQPNPPPLFEEMVPTTAVLPIKGTTAYGDWASVITGSESYEYRFVDNLNTSGAGSLAAAYGTACPTNTICVVIPRVSGSVTYSPGTTYNFLNKDRFVFAMHWAPSPGFYINRLKLTLRNSDYLLFQHWGCFNDYGATQGPAKCIQGYGQSGERGNDVIIQNAGGSFAFDSIYSIGIRYDNFTFIDIMNAYPLPNPNGHTAQGILLGEAAGSVSNNPTNLAIIRGVFAHGTHRCPFIQSAINSVVAGMVCYNYESQYLSIGGGNANDTNGKLDLYDMLFVSGPNTIGNQPMRWEDATGSPASIHTYYDGMRGFPDSGVFDDTPVSNMIIEETDNVVTVEATPQATLPDGFTRTEIDAGDAGEEEYANNVCLIAGPRSGDRLAIFQQACNELSNRFSGSGSQGGLIDSVDDVGGIPSIATGSCDPYVADDCNIGQPALPTEGNAGNSDTFINAFWTANEAARCAVSADGTPGC